VLEAEKYRFKRRSRLGSKIRLALFKKQNPQTIAAIIAIAIILVIVIEILEDVVVEGAPLTSGPLVWVWNGVISVTRNVTNTISSWGYMGVFFLMLLESSSLPIPSEVVLPFAGYLVSLGSINFWIANLAATTAGISGALIDYFVGMKGWRYLTKKGTIGKVFFNKNQLDTATSWFKRYGTIVVLFSRLVPGFRTVVSFPAGAIKMPLSKFIVYTAVGCLLWNALLIYLGFFLGSRWTQVAGVSHYLLIAAIAAFICAVIGYFVWKRSKK
jgi:membrane protein DedA with SNARE-associated domain